MVFSRAGGTRCCRRCCAVTRTRSIGSCSKTCLHSSTLATMSVSQILSLASVKFLDFNHSYYIHVDPILVMLLSFSVFFSVIIDIVGDCCFLLSCSTVLSSVDSRAVVTRPVVLSCQLGRSTEFCCPRRHWHGCMTSYALSYGVA